MRHTTVRRITLFLAAAGLGLLPVRGGHAADPDSRKWEKEIARFEKQDAKSPPPKHGVLFAGSSSIRLWKLGKSFPGKDYINRGFGGSQIADSTHFAPRIIFKAEPRLIVLYAGDNDVAAGKTPERVAADFRAFVKEVHGRLPKTKIVFISIKPSIARLSMVGKQKQANDLIEAYCKAHAGLTFLDVATPMLGADGKPRKELFAKDGLHLNEKGYELWASKLGPYLK